MRSEKEIKKAIQHMESARRGAYKSGSDSGMMAATGVIKALEWVLGDQSPLGFGELLEDMDVITKEEK